MVEHSKVKPLDPISYSDRDYCSFIGHTCLGLFITSEAPKRSSNESISNICSLFTFGYSECQRSLMHDNESIGSHTGGKILLVNIKKCIGNSSN